MKSTESAFPFVGPCTRGAANVSGLATSVPAALVYQFAGASDDEKWCVIWTVSLDSRWSHVDRSRGAPEDRRSWGFEVHEQPYRVNSILWNGIDSDPCRGGASNSFAFKVQETDVFVPAVYLAIWDAGLGSLG